MELIAIALLVVVVAEIAATVLWYPPYCRSGIALYTRRIETMGTVAVPTLTGDLREKFKGEFLYKDKILFKELSKTEIAFHEKLFQIKFGSSDIAPISHGLITMAPGRGIEVKGLLDWSVVSVCVSGVLMLTGVFGEEDSVVLPLFAIFIIGVLYYFDRKQFNQVADYLREKYEGSPSPQPVSREERGL